MTPQPTTEGAPDQPEDMIHEPSIDEARAMAGPEPDNVTPINGSDTAPPPPTPEQVKAAQEAIEADMREAVPFNRLAVHTGFQRAIQAAVVGTDPNKTGKLCSAFRDWAEGEALLGK